MASLNKVILIGNLGKDPESRFLPSGDAVCNFSIATTETWKDKATGEKREATEWHKIAIFGKLAEIASQYLHKGSQVYLEGKLKTHKWTDKSGQDRYTTEIACDVMKMLGSRGEGGQRQESQQQQPQQQPQQPQQQPQQPQQQPQPQQPQPQQPSNGGGFADFDDDIPFDRLARGLSGYAI